MPRLPFLLFVTPFPSLRLSLDGRELKRGCNLFDNARPLTYLQPSRVATAAPSQIMPKSVMIMSLQLPFPEEVVKCPDCLN